MISQLGRLKTVFLFIFLVPLLVVTAVVTISHVFQLPIQNLLVDTVVVSNQNRFIGFGSNVIILFWAATAAIIFFNILVELNRSGNDAYFRFLVYFGLFTVVLLLDDLFLLHEGLSSLLAVSENLIYFGYLIILLAGLRLFLKFILQTEFVLLFFSLSCFGLAIIAGIYQNQLQEQIGLYRVLLEATLKLFGVVSWFAYFSRVAYLKLQEVRD